MKSRFRKQYIKIARKLTLADLQAGAESNDLTMDNIVSAGRVEQSSNFFMGVFTRQGLKNAIDAFGLTEALARLGLTDLQVDIDTSDPHTHRLYVFTGDACDNNKICEMVVKKGPVNLQQDNLPKFPDRSPNLLQIEWLLLQNPRISFDEIRPQLPGQQYPGLGIGDRMLQILIIMTRRLRLEGLINKPRYYHTAFMFTKDFVFTNPRNQAILFSINRDLVRKYKFHTVAWAAHYDCIINHETGSTLVWDSDYLILPLEKYMLKYFYSKEYQKAVEREMKNYTFIIDINKFQKSMQKNKIPIYEQLI
ncbi:hypothetical protein KJ762_15365 [bacterium]|nr:hypothetical protein [bacterium]MBU1065166.1 hypothetical protein [bacterium]MBU1635866.1 hypothetical protein [bacterium]MBU1873487.1 hypothetical protein [bacterium]